jgi:hypothetical protein
MGVWHEDKTIKKKVFMYGFNSIIMFRMTLEDIMEDYPNAVSFILDGNKSGPDGSEYRSRLYR